MKICRIKCLRKVLLSMSMCLVASGWVVNAAPDEWQEWAGWVEQRYPIGDAAGHGPDIGSDEWANALDKRLGIGGGKEAVPEVKSDAWRRIVENKLRPAGEAAEQRKLLSSHDTLARFSGIEAQVCRGRTALCPDRCGHSGKVATFEVLEYLRYEKTGKYGDARQKRFQILVEGQGQAAAISAEILKTITALKPGATVRLAWHHDYVTREGSGFPERTINRLEVVPGALEKPSGK